MGLLANLWNSMVYSSIEPLCCYVFIVSVLLLLSNGRYFLLLFYTGEGMSELSLADRATIANMSPEYGATMGFFPVDHVTLQYLQLTGRSDQTVSPQRISLFQLMY